MDPFYKLALLDVISLFTNVPIDRALESIENRWDSISKNTSIPLLDFKMAVEFVLSSTFPLLTFVTNKFLARQWTLHYLL